MEAKIKPLEKYYVVLRIAGIEERCVITPVNVTLETAYIKRDEYIKRWGYGIIRPAVRMER